MKKRSLFIRIAFSLILVVLSFLFVQEIVAMQAAETTQEDTKYTSTVMNTTDDMSVYYSGVCSPKQSEAFFEKYDSYDIYYKNDQMIAVTLKKSSSPADNGFYQIEFDIPGTKKSVFITGLTAKNVQSAQDSLLAFYTGKEDFSIYDLDFIDAEKIGDKGVDSDLCWAGQASDMLTYAGWTKKAGFSGEDDILELFSEHFFDKAGVCSTAISWFMNGNNQGSSPKDLKKGAFLPQYPYNTVFKSNYITGYGDGEGNSSVLFYRDMFSSLRRGDAVGFDISWLNSEGTVDGGHALTLFGYVYNKSYTDDSLKHYDSVIIADSDNDKGVYRDRSEAPNSLSITHTKSCTYDSQKTLLMDRYGNGVITSFHTLKYYSDSLPYETNPSATKNVLTSFDLVPTGVNISISESPMEDDTPAISSDNNLYYSVLLENCGMIAYNSPCRFDIKVSDETGRVVETKSVTKDIKVDKNDFNVLSINDPLAPLPEGKYTLELTAYPDASKKEAYTMNNTYKKSFELKKSLVDTSAVSLALSVPDFGKDYSAQGKISYTNKSYITDNGYNCKLGISYFKDGEWSSWSDWYDSTGNLDVPVGNTRSKTQSTTATKLTLPKTADVTRDGTQAKLRLILWSDESAPGCIFSEPCDLKFLSMTVENLNDGFEFDNLPAGATELANSQSFDYIIKNNSSYDGGELTAKYYFYAESEDADSDFSGEQTRLTDDKTVTLGYGKDTGKLSLTGWNKDIRLSGRQSFHLMFTNPGTDADETYYLGFLSFAEDPSCTVTTTEDVSDAYDGKISLREAVEYAKTINSDDRTIRFDSTLNKETFELDSPIVIDEDLTIDGISSYKGYKYGIRICSSEGSMFDVQPGTKFELNGLIFNNMSADRGGVVSADSADVNISDCKFEALTSTNGGGVVYSKKSTVLIKNAIFQGGSSPKGCMIYNDENSNCQVLNSLFYNGGSESESLIENVDSSLDIVSSTFVECSTYKENSAIVRSNTSANILGCIFSGNNFTYDISGPINVFGTCYDKVDDSAQINDCIQKVKKSKLFILDDYNYIKTNELFGGLDDISNLFYELQTKSYTGVTIKPSATTLVYSYGTETFTDSGIPLLFDSKYYLKDMFGKTRKAVFGCDTTPYVEPTVGKTPVTIKATQVKKKNSETYIGRSAADAAKLITKADVALITTNTLVNGVKKGNITAPMIQNITPNDMIVFIKKINGKDLTKIFETAIDYMLKDKKKYASKTLQIAGAAVTYKASAKKGKRITSIKINGKKLSKTKTYKVAADNSVTYHSPYKKYGKFNESANTYDWYDAFVKYFNKSSSYIKKSVKKQRFIKK